jgi:hypothetical protein
VGYPKGKRPQAAHAGYGRFSGGQLQGAKGSGMAVPSNMGVSGGVSGMLADTPTMGIGLRHSRLVHSHERKERGREIEIFYNTYFLIYFK